MNLEQRFLKFLSSLSGSEDIDAVGLPAGKEKSKKADFFLKQRRVIVEVKSLQVDTEGKVEETLAPHRERPEFPLFYGKIELSKVLDYLPDGDDINRKIYEKTTRSIEQAFRSADKQILATKEAFGLTDSWGLLVMLSEDVEFFDPSLVGRKTSEMLTKKNEDGSFRYNQVAGVLIVCEGHMMRDIKKTKAFPIIALEGPTAQTYDDYHEITELLLQSWAKFNGVPLWMSDSKIISEMKFESVAERNKAQETHVRRSELWEREYDCNPYLRHLGTEELIRFGQGVMAELAPRFMVGTEKKDMKETAGLLQRFSDFMQEMKHRGLDMRELRRRANSCD